MSENYLGPSTIEKIRQAQDLEDQQERKLEEWEKAKFMRNISGGMDSPSVTATGYHPYNYGEWAREVGPGGESYEVPGEATVGEYAWGEELKVYQWDGKDWVFCGQRS